MTLRRFLDTAYYILVEDFQRMGHHVLAALEKTEQWRGRKIEDGEPVDPSEAATVRQNQESFLKLQEMMGL